MHLSLWLIFILFDSHKKIYLLYTEYSSSITPGSRRAEPSAADLFCWAVWASAERSATPSKLSPPRSSLRCHDWCSWSCPWKSYQFLMEKEALSQFSRQFSQRTFHPSVFWATPVLPQNINDQQRPPISCLTIFKWGLDILYSKIHVMTQGQHGWRDGSISEQHKILLD